MKKFEKDLKKIQKMQNKFQKQLRKDLKRNASFNKAFFVTDKVQNSTNCQMKTEKKYNFKTL